VIVRASDLKRSEEYENRGKRLNRTEVYYIDVKRGDSISFWDQSIRIDVTALPTKGWGKRRKTDVIYDLMDHGRSYIGNELICKRGGITFYTDDGNIRMINLGNHRCGRRAFLRVEVPEGVRYNLSRGKRREQGNGQEKKDYVTRPAVRQKRESGGNGRLVDNFLNGIVLPNFIE